MLIRPSHHIGRSNRSYSGAFWTLRAAPCGPYQVGFPLSTVAAHWDCRNSKPEAGWTSSRNRPATSVAPSRRQSFPTTFSRKRCGSPNTSMTTSADARSGNAVRRRSSLNGMSFPPRLRPAQYRRTSAGFEPMAFGSAKGMSRRFIWGVPEAINPREFSTGWFARVIDSGQRIAEPGPPRARRRARSRLFEPSYPD